MKRSRRCAHLVLVGGIALLSSSSGCRRSETVTTAETPAVEPAAKAPAPIDLGSTRETELVEAFYPVPLASGAAPEETEEE
jgi:hypothetical protein